MMLLQPSQWYMTRSQDKGRDLTRKTLLFLLKYETLNTFWKHFLELHYLEPNDTSQHNK